MWVRTFVGLGGLGLVLGCAGAPSNPAPAGGDVASPSAAPAGAGSVAPAGGPSVGERLAAAAENEGTSLLSFTAGAAVVQATSTYTRLAEPAYAIDGSQSSYWQFDYNELTDQSLVIELAAPARLTHVGLLDPQELASNPRVAVAVADSVDGPWRELGMVTPKAGQRVGLVLDPPQTASYVRYLIPARASADADAVLIAEAYAYGEFVAPPATAQVAGKWQGGWFFGGFELRQEGAIVTGCQDNGAVLTGVVDGRTLHLQFLAPNETPARAEVVWTGAAKKPFLAQTLGEGEPGGQEYGEIEAFEGVNCMPGGPTGKAEVDPLQAELEEKGKVLVYDLLFDFNKSTLRPASDPTLDRIAAMLVAQPAWRVRIEGHTDNVGGASYNQRLSEARAASTVQALIQRGIDASRLESAGFGDTRPVAPNDAAGGRAANRRVEVVRL